MNHLLGNISSGSVSRHDVGFPYLGEVYHFLVRALFSIRLGFKSRYGLNIAVVGVGGMDGCSLAEGWAGGKEGAGSFWDMTFSASLIRSSCFAKASSALFSKPEISFSKYSTMTWGCVGGLKSDSANS